MLDNEKDLFIKNRLQQDEFISKKADDLFHNFNTDEIKKQKEQKKKINPKYVRIAAAFATVVILFGAANVYATTQGYDNIFFMIQYLTTGEKTTIDDKNEILSDRDIAISFEPIRITENISIQIANLQIKEDEATLFINVNEKDLETDKDTVPLRYNVYDASRNKLCEQNSLKEEDETLQTYTEELKLSNYNTENSILELEIYKSNSDLITTIKIDLNTKSIEVLGEEEALQKISEIELKEFLGNSVQYENEDGESITGTCIDVTNISYCGGLYTVTFTYCFLGDDSIFEVDINDYNIYQNTFTITLNEGDEQNTFQIVSRDKEIIIKSSEEKEEGKLEITTDDANESNENAFVSSAQVTETQIDNYASTMSWTEYWAPGLKLKYPTTFQLEEVGGTARGSRQGELSTTITGIATGVNPETKEIIESNMKIEIFEPEYIECEDGEEYCTTVSKEYGGPECNGSGMTSNTGLVWYETRVEDEEETKIIITHYEDIQWGYKMVITVGNPNNYKVTNIINWLLNSISITNY